VAQWTFFDPAIPTPAGGAASFGFEPLPTNGGTVALQDIDWIFYAAFVAKLWDGDATSVTFSGQTKSKDLHALDLSRAVFNVLVEQSADTKLDWSNATKFPLDGASESNPYFTSFARMTKYIDAYSLVYDQIAGDATYLSNYAQVEGWFLDAATYAKLRMGNKLANIFGGTGGDVSTFTFADTFYDDTYSNPFTHYTSGGVGQYGVTWGQAAGMNNRVWDHVGLVGHYGLLFNNTSFKAWAGDLFEFTIQSNVYPDGTFVEWYRSEIGKEVSGLLYTHLTLYHMTKLAFSHAVAIENGLVGSGSDKGKYFDYTTSLGSDEQGWPSYGGTSTSGGSKNLKLVITNLSKYFRTTANGGWNDVRFTEGGTVIPTFSKPPSPAIAMANAYYKDDALEDFYMLRSSAGYDGIPRYYGDGLSPVMPSNGAWLQRSLGESWGATSIHAGFASIGLMEDFVFGAIAPVIGTRKRNTLKIIYD
jgi:hypothetical protein